MIFSRKKDTPETEQGIIQQQTKGQITAAEALQEYDPTQTPKIREFSQMVMEDGLSNIYLKFYLVDSQGDPILDSNGNMVGNPLYNSAYEPLRPWFSRILRLGNLTPQEEQKIKWNLHAAVQKARCLVPHNGEDPRSIKQIHFTIDSMEQYLAWSIIMHSRGGTTLKALTENKKTLNIMNGGQEKKKGWFG